MGAHMTPHRQFSRMSAEAVLLARARSLLMFAASLRASGATAYSMDATRLTAIHARHWTQRLYELRTNGLHGYGIKKS